MRNELLDAQLHVQAKLGVHVGVGPGAPADGEAERAAHARWKETEHATAFRVRTPAARR